MISKRQLILTYRYQIDAYMMENCCKSYINMISSENHNQTSNFDAHKILVWFNYLMYMRLSISPSDINMLSKWYQYLMCKWRSMPWIDVDMISIWYLYFYIHMTFNILWSKYDIHKILIYCQYLMYIWYQMSTSKDDIDMLVIRCQ